MRWTEHAVVIAGGGPTGMMLGAELALAGVDVAILERRSDHELTGSRAGGFHVRTTEVLDQRGVAERFLREATLHDSMAFGPVTLDLRDLPTRHPYVVGLWQNAIERIMADWLAELPVRIYHGCAVAGLAQDDDGVDVLLADGGPLRARYLVGCDGGRSVVRKAAGIAFPGWDATRSTLIAELETTEPPPAGLRHDAAGVHAFSPLEDGRHRVVTSERQVGTGPEPTLDDLRAALVAVYGTDYGVHSATWISRFTDATRQAAAYRAGRVLLAGDAAHVHYPVGGQGLGLGVQDAVNLGWKLALVVAGTAPESLLDSYHDERHPVAARILRHTMALGAMQRRDERMEALVAVVGEIAGMDEPRRHLAGVGTGLDVRYALGDGHPLLGRRMPDLDLQTADGPVRVFELLHEGRPLLLDLRPPGATGASGWSAAPGPTGPTGPSGTPAALRARAWADRVRAVKATHAGEWVLPVLGPVAAPEAVLVRPDGYVAWVGDATGAGLHDALTTWCGAPTGA